MRDGAPAQKYLPGWCYRVLPVQGVARFWLVVSIGMEVHWSSSARCWAYPSEGITWVGVARDQSATGGYRPVQGCSPTWDYVVDFSRAERPGASKHLRNTRLQPPPMSGVLSRPIFADGMGHAVRLAARRIPCFEHPVHPDLRFKTQLGGF